jgi:hypothetical protein
VKAMKVEAAKDVLIDSSWALAYLSDGDDE